MEFTEEYAVFQSAIQLADKLTQKGLARFDGDGADSKNSVSIVKEAVQEVKRGLKHPLSMEEASNWSSCLAYALTVHVLKARRANLTGLLTRYEPVITGLPAMNSTFYFGVVIKCEWLDPVFQFLNETQLDEDCKVNLITDLLDHCNRHSQETGPKVLSKLYTKLLLTYNDVMHQNASNQELMAVDLKKIRIMEKIVKSLGNLGQKCATVSSQTTFEIILCYLSSVLVLTGQPLLVLSDSQLLQQKKRSIPESYKELNVVDLLSIKALTVPLIQVIAKHNTPDTNNILLSETINELSKILVTKCTEEHLEEFCNGYVSMTKRKYSNEEDLYIIALVRVFHHACCRINEWKTKTEKGNATEGIVLSKVDKVSELLTVTRDRLREEQTTENDGMRRFEKALFVIEELPGESEGKSNWQEWLLSCNDDEIRFDQRWIRCLQNNMQIFSQTEYVMKLLRQLSSFPSPQREQLQQVTLQIYSLLSFKDQDAVLSQVMTSSGGCGFPYAKSHDYQKALTDTFNRVVGQEAGLDQITKLISALALQSPAETLCKMVNEAIHSKAQSLIMVEVWSRLPSLCTLCLNKETDTFMLNKLLGDAAFGGHQSSTEWQNLVILTQGVLQQQPSTGDEHQHHYTSLLAPEIFIQQVIVPRLCTDNLAQTLLALDLLNAGLNTVNDCLSGNRETRGALSENIGGSLLAFLCVCLNDSLLLWDRTNCGNVGLKESSTAALRSIVKIFAHEGFRIDNNTWLVQFVRELDWTIMFLIEEILDPTIPKRVPVSLSSCSTLPNTVTFDNGFPAIFNVLELAKLSPTFSGFMKIEGGIEISCTSHQHAELILHLCQILPNSICEEWQNMSIFLLDKMSEEQSQSKETHLCTLLTEVLLMLTRGDLNNAMCDNMNSNLKWNHLSSCYVSTMKNVCLKNPDLGHSVLFHCISCVCQCLVSLPPVCKDSLLVLTLDLMSNYQKKTQLYKLEKQDTVSLDGMKKEMDQVQCLINNLEDESITEPLIKKAKEIVHPSLSN